MPVSFSPLAIFAMRTVLAVPLLFWIVVTLSTIRENRKQKWVVKAATPLPAPPRRPRVAVVIPARNEERNLQACLDSVRALDWPDLRIVVIDDRSTDATPRIARAAAEADARVTVMEGTDLPEGWMGKCWALHQAAAKADGEWLLFLDADVVVDPRALRQAYDWAAANGARMLSGYGFLVLGTFWEQVIMPVIGGMIVGANPLDEVNDPAHPRVVCNGQFILIEREAYREIGGHEAVKAAIIDDMALATRAKERKIAYRMLFCRELFRTRMYTSFGEIWRGWRKNLFAGLGYRWKLALGVVFFVLWTAVVPPLVLAVLLALGARPLAPSVLLAAGATAAMLGYRIYASRIFAQSWIWFWTHPLGAAIVSGIFFESALRGISRSTVDWKGRSYAAAGAPGAAAAPTDGGATPPGGKK